MAQIPLQLAYKETEQRLLSAINECLSYGVPMFLIENILKEIGAEVAKQSEAQYQESLAKYNAELAEEQKAAEETSNETSSD